MISAIIKKEINDFFRYKITMLFIVLFSIIITYSFYSAVDLYSKASASAVNNPLYASGFEPVPGVFVPTLGGLFIVLSLIAPFIFIHVISTEKRNNTITLIAQFPVSLLAIYTVKYIASIIFLFIIIISLSPIFFVWIFLGGHLPINETLILISGYILYGMLIISISFFTASLFDNSSKASMAALFIIMFSWFLDFGKDMNILPYIEKISKWSLTNQLKIFENGIFSLQSVIFFILLISLFFYLAYIFFNFSIRYRIRLILITILSFMFLFWMDSKININFDLTESRRNSFSSEETKFLKSLPPIKIDVYLEKTDSRAKDYESDFLKKLKLIKRDVKVNYMEGKELDKNYGIFKYTIEGKSDTTYSTSKEEIFPILEQLSGIKIIKNSSNKRFKGYPLVVTGHWSMPFVIFYIVLLPLGIFIIYLKNNLRRNIK